MLNQLYGLGEGGAPFAHAVGPYGPIRDTGAVFFFESGKGMAKLFEAWTKRGRYRKVQQRVEIFAGKLKKQFNSLMLFGKTAERPVPDLRQIFCGIKH